MLNTAFAFRTWTVKLLNWFSLWFDRDLCLLHKFMGCFILERVCLFYYSISLTFFILFSFWQAVCVRICVCVFLVLYCCLFIFDAISRLFFRVYLLFFCSLHCYYFKIACFSFFLMNIIFPTCFLYFVVLLCLFFSFLTFLSFVTFTHFLCVWFIWFTFLVFIYSVQSQKRKNWQLTLDSGVVRFAKSLLREK